MIFIILVKKIFKERATIYLTKNLHQNIIFQGFFQFKALESNYLKRKNQAKIIRKSLFSFWLFNMVIRCEHVLTGIAKVFWVAVAM